MRYLIEIGAKENLEYTVFCCGHVLAMYFIILIIDLTFNLFTLIFEIFITCYNEVPDQLWIGFYTLCLMSFVVGPAGITGFLKPLLVYTFRILIIWMVTMARFVHSMRFLMSSQDGGLLSLSKLLLILPLLSYTFCLYISIRMFSYSSSRYRGYFDVDVELRNELNKRIQEHVDEEMAKK